MKSPTPAMQLAVSAPRQLTGALRWVRRLAFRLIGSAALAFSTLFVALMAQEVFDHRSATPDNSFAARTLQRMDDALGAHAARFGVPPREPVAPAPAAKAKPAPPPAAKAKPVRRSAAKIVAREPVVPPPPAARSQPAPAPMAKAPPAPAPVAKAPPAPAAIQDVPQTPPPELRNKPGFRMEPNGGWSYIPAVVCSNGTCVGGAIARQPDIRPVAVAKQAPAAISPRRPTTVAPREPIPASQPSPAPPASVAAARPTSAPATGAAAPASAPAGASANTIVINGNAPHASTAAASRIAISEVNPVVNVRPVANTAVTATSNAPKAGRNTSAGSRTALAATAPGSARKSSTVRLAPGREASRSTRSAVALRTTSRSRQTSAQPSAAPEPALLAMVGGRGIGQTADLGRGSPTYGAAPDVFNTSHHVVARTQCAAGLFVGSAYFQADQFGRAAIPCN